MRRFFYWYVPLGAALISGAIFAHGFYSFAHGDTGTAVSVAVTKATNAAPPSNTIAPLILGDSLARGTGDETGLGIGGRVVEDLRQRHIRTNDIINLAVNGARTGDLLQQLESRNVQALIAAANVIIVSIGGNDLWGDNWRNAAPQSPEKVMDAVLARIGDVVQTIRRANPDARLYIIGLYNPFAGTRMGMTLSPFINDWNSKLIDRFARDPNIVIVQTADIFKWRDRLSVDQFHPGNEGYALIARRIADTF
ncbi:MAG TPA: GDSL-type esterase/lipase family protein [Thermoanaerobaculia bacterium]|nr:GDSL-type esterase/lipase family protein [Thermoanaerobaculia bacterium]